MHLEDGTHWVPVSAAMKIELLKGASKGENEHNLCHSPLVAGEMENVRFFKYWYFKEHFSAQGNKVNMMGLGKSRMANSILSSWGNNISMEVLGGSWITASNSFQQNVVNFNHWWRYCICSLDLISAEGMSSASCRYLQAFCGCTGFTKNMEKATCLGAHPTVIYSCFRTGRASIVQQQLRS